MIYLRVRGRGKRWRDKSEGEGKWKRVTVTSANRRRDEDTVSAPVSRNLSLNQNVQKHFLGQGFMALGEEYSGG